MCAASLRFLGARKCVLRLRLVVAGHKEICAAPSLLYVWAIGTVCYFTSLSGHKEIWAVPSLRCFWARGKYVLHLHFVISGHKEMCAAPSLRYIWVQGNVCCTFASLYLGTKKYLLHQHRAATSCYRLPWYNGHCPSSWFNFTTTFRILDFFLLSRCYWQREQK
jgi:hypothetical protein